MVAEYRATPCRIRVEGEIRKTEEGKARNRAAASRVDDVPTVRALKRELIEVGDDAETPEATSASAPSSLFASAFIRACGTRVCSRSA